MSFRLVISDVIDVPVSVSIKDGDKSAPFAFTLQCTRVSSADYRAATADDSKVLVRDFLAANVRGWRGQRLVIDDATGEPATYSPDAFAAMLGVVGLEGAIFGAYVKALVAADTAEGRQKN